MAYKAYLDNAHRLRTFDTYSEKLDMIQDLVIEGEVIAWNDIDPRLFLYLPVLQAQSFAFAQQVLE